jgi:hypothetical protein
MERLLQSFSIDPVAYPERQIADDTSIVDVPDGWVVQSAERLRLPKEPGSDGRIGVEVYPQTDPALQDQVVGFEQNLFGGRGDGPLQTIAVTQGVVGPLKVAEGFNRGQRSSPRRRSTLTSRPHTAALHQRRLWLGESSVKNSEHPSPAQRRTKTSGSETVAAADWAMADRKAGRRPGANRRCHDPPVRVSWRHPASRASCSLMAAIAPAGGWRP